MRLQKPWPPDTLHPCKNSVQEVVFAMQVDLPPTLGIPHNGHRPAPANHLPSIGFRSGPRRFGPVSGVPDFPHGSRILLKDPGILPEVLRPFPIFGRVGQIDVLSPGLSRKVPVQIQD